jgi:hypothetical protein
VLIRVHFKAKKKKKRKKFTDRYVCGHLGVFTTLQATRVCPFLTGCVIVWDIHQNRLPSICSENFCKMCTKLSRHVSYLFVLKCSGFLGLLTFSPPNGPIFVQPYILLRKSTAVQIRSTIVWRQISLYPMFTCEFTRGLHIHIYTQLHHRIEQVLYISLEFNLMINCCFYTS